MCEQASFDITIIPAFCKSPGSYNATRTQAMPIFISPLAGAVASGILAMNFDTIYGEL
jgi:hypothetical protein